MLKYYRDIEINSIFTMKTLIIGNKQKIGEHSPIFHSNLVILSLNLSTNPFAFQNARAA